MGAILLNVPNIHRFPASSPCASGCSTQDLALTRWRISFATVFGVAAFCGLSVVVFGAQAQAQAQAQTQAQAQPKGEPAGSSRIRPWPTVDRAPRSIEDLVPAPDGFDRVPLGKNEFGGWLRGLPVRESKPEIHLYDGRIKRDQSAKFAVLDIDVGSSDLQQCADAVIRLRAEYLWSQGRSNEVCFHFTSGDPFAFPAWRKGIRPLIHGRKVAFEKRAAADASYVSFRRYLDVIFTYAGTQSLAAELPLVGEKEVIEPGDIFIDPGSPGHAVLVVDVVASSRNGERRFLLAQGFMPAQDIHLLRNLARSDPWYSDPRKGAVDTPEWHFERAQLHRFSPNPEKSCLKQ